jgi:transcriptional regulator with XRE-family HTH domain
MNVGKAIKELRKRQALSQEELAAKAKMTQAALSQIENGKRPGTETLKKISAALGVSESLVYVMGLEREDVPEERISLYDELFPVIQGLVSKLASSGNNKPT